MKFSRIHWAGRSSFGPGIHREDGCGSLARSSRPGPNLPNATNASLAALEKSLALAPRNAQAVALQGFLFSAQNRIGEARASFDQAIALDGRLGNAWLGRGLSLDQSYRLEPSRVAGFNQAFRSIIPEAVEGANAAPEFDVAALSLEQKLGRGT